MATAYFEAKSKAKLLGKAEGIWEIDDTVGPLAAYSLSRAKCFVNVPTGDQTTSADIKLRFHLGLWQYQKNVDNNNTNSTGNPQNQKKNGDQCNGISTGYYLLVDVLSTHENIALVINKQICNEGTQSCSVNPSASGTIILEHGTPRKDLVVMQKFWEPTNGLTMSDGFLRCQLNVAAYEFENTGTNSPDYITNLKKRNVVTDRVTNIPPTLGDENSDVALKCLDGIVIKAHKNILSAKSPYLCRQFESTSEISTNLRSEPVLLVLRWMYSDQLPTTTPKLTIHSEKKYFAGICQVAKEFELSNQFWNCLEQNLMSFFSPEEMAVFVRTVQAYQLTTPPGLMEKIEHIKKEISYNENDFMKDYEFVQKWNAFTCLLRDVNCQAFVPVPNKPEVSSKLPQHNNSGETVVMEVKGMMSECDNNKSFNAPLGTNQSSVKLDTQQSSISRLNKSQNVCTVENNLESKLGLADNVGVDKTDDTGNKSDSDSSLDMAYEIVHENELDALDENETKAT